MALPLPSIPETEMLPRSPLPVRTTGAGGAFTSMGRIFLGWFWAVKPSGAESDVTEYRFCNATRSSARGADPGRGPLVEALADCAGALLGDADARAAHLQFRQVVHLVEVDDEGEDRGELLVDDARVASHRVRGLADVVHRYALSSSGSARQRSRAVTSRRGRRLGLRSRPCAR